MASPLSPSSREPESPKARTRCLVCRSRKVRCDRSLPSCGNCDRLGVQCPGYDDDNENVSRGQLMRSVQAIYNASGVEKRRFGSCEECRTTKNRCTKTRPSCRRCASRGLQCIYLSPVQRGLENAPASPLTESIDPRSTGQQQMQRADHSRPQPNAMFLPSPEVPFSDLCSETLPEDPSFRSWLIRIYFERVHQLKCCAIIHKPTFLHSLDHGSVIEDYGEPLLYTMCALAARVIYTDNLHSSHNTSPHSPLIPGDAWAEKARKEILVSIHVPSIQHLMAIILLCKYALRTDQYALAYVLTGCTFRAIQLLRLDSPRHTRLPFEDSQVNNLNREIENRLVWACYTFDALVSSGVDTNSSWHDRVPNVPLPCLDRDFLAQTSGASYFLHDILQPDRAAVIRQLELPTLMIVLIRLRVRVLRLIRTAQPTDVNIWDTSSAFMEIIKQLELFHSNLADNYRLTDLNLYILKDQHLIGAVFCLHLLYNAAMFDLTRTSLAGFTFPLAAAFRDAPGEFRLQCQKRCQFHANEASDIVRKGLAHAPVAFDDTFCPDAILESTKIQIIYSATVANDDQTVTATRQNVRSNLQALKLLHIDKTAINPYIRLIQPLCMVFGYRDIAEEWWDSEIDSDTPAEVTGSADIDHLSTSAPFRKAMSEIRAKRTPQDMDSSPGARSITRTEGSSEAQPPIIGVSPMGFENLGHTASYQGSDFVDSPAERQFPSTAAVAMPSHDQAAPLPDPLSASLTTTGPTLEDYIRAADEMGTYITWDTSEFSNMPLWFDSDWFNQNPQG